MALRRKVRKCRICKKSPVWRGGDVKNPGPYCKKCLQKHVWTGRPRADDEESVADQYVDYLSGLASEPPFGFRETPRFPERPDPYAESLLGLPLGPDEEDWEWICRTAAGASPSRRGPGDHEAPTGPGPE
jgi:hypothetical protein